MSERLEAGNQIWFMSLDIRSDELTREGCEGGVMFAATWADSGDVAVSRIQRYLVSQDVHVSEVSDLQPYDRLNLEDDEFHSDVPDELESQLLPDDGHEMWFGLIHAYESAENE